MNNTTTQTETSAVLAARTHTTKKLGKFYTYRGWLVKKWDNNYLNDPEIRGVEWHTYRNMAEYDSGRSIDIVRTLRDAKTYIDICINRRNA